MSSSTYHHQGPDQFRPLLLEIETMEMILAGILIYAAYCTGKVVERRAGKHK